MYKDDLEFYNDFFRKQKKIRLEDDFKSQDQAKIYCGVISIKVNKDARLTLYVLIPHNYPFGTIHFLSNEVSGVEHFIERNDSMGGICLNTPFINHLYSRLDLEVKRLRKWVKQYYKNKNSLPEYYEPLWRSINTDLCMLFDETPEDLSTYRFDKNQFGFFDFSVLNNTEFITTFLADGLGNLKKDSIRRLNDNNHDALFHKGIWVFLDEEPKTIRASSKKDEQDKLKRDSRKRAMDWKELYQYFPDGFDAFYRDNRRKLKTTLRPDKGRNQVFVALAVGYVIQSQNEAAELNWDICFLPVRYFTSKALFHNVISTDPPLPVYWGISENISYQRYFGRGGLSSSLANAKLCVVGAGAIGSTLLESLTRGGAKTIALTDNDHVVSGNICRSSYSIKDVGKYKVISLADKLRDLSPHLEVYESTEGLSVINWQQNPNEVIESLELFDVIFDCSADNQVLQMMSDIRVGNSIINLSITEDANELICVVKRPDDVYSLPFFKSQIIRLYERHGVQEHWVGTGCHSPTFRASYQDISSLINLALKVINNDIQEGKQLHSFVLENRGKDIITNYFHRFISANGKYRLHIASSVLDTTSYYANIHYPLEFGGVFFGYYHQNEFFVLDTVIPEKFQNSATSFEPNHKHINKLIQDKHDSYEGIISYLGEWHTHPDMPNFYSLKDYLSMVKIEEEAEMTIPYPLLMIASVKNEEFLPQFYMTKKRKLIPFIPIR